VHSIAKTHSFLLIADCPFLMRFTAAWVYTAMATAGVSLHEKSKEYETACDLLRQLLGGCSPAPDVSEHAHTSAEHASLSHSGRGVALSAVK
jgi:hypothetical protein